MIGRILAVSGVAAVVIAVSFLHTHTLLLRASQEKKPDLTEAKYYGASTCYKCHADSVDGKPGKWGIDFVRMDEFTIWRTKDKHALACVVLDGPRGQRISQILRIDAPKAPQCLNCHATTSRPERKGKGFSNLDGVSCDGCHGPAQHWIIDHALEPDTWRLKTPQEKEDLGMYDVRNPTKRAQMCASCHVGNAAEGKVVTHAMYAAGHPPLPSFEVAAFSKNLPQHWYDAAKVPFFKKADAKVREQNYAADAEFQQTKLVLATCSESMRAMVNLIANRATLDGKPRDPATAWPPPWLRPFAKNQPNDRWPELAKPMKEPNADELRDLWPEIAMAQSDCYACHHDLKAKSWRQIRGYPGKPGRPQFQPWPFALAPIALSDPSEFAATFKKLAAALDETPFGQPKQVASAALELETLAKKMRSPTSSIDQDTNAKLLKALLEIGTKGLMDYDSARQIAWATQAVYLEWKPTHPQAIAVAKIFKQLDDDLNLTLGSDARAPFVKRRYDLTKDLAKLETDFIVAVKSPSFLKDFQEISDGELASSLSRINDYDPTAFKRNMENLRSLLWAK
jgi:hypothetical protein